MYKLNYDLFAAYKIWWYFNYQVEWDIDNITQALCGSLELDAGAT